MKWEYNDGGREAAGFKGKTGDCVVRAIAIATGWPYDRVYHHLALQCQTRRLVRQRKASARNGCARRVYHKYLTELGVAWTPTMRIGQGCRVHLRSGELPMGRLIVRLSRHLVAVIDGVIQDTYNPDRGGTRCVYGYYEVK